jgi:hypothetical protein
MRRCVDTSSQSADDGKPCRSEISGQFFGQLASANCRSASAYDRHGKSILLSERSADIQQHRRIGNHS